jgi:hypothetical protein
MNVMDGWNVESKNADTQRACFSTDGVAVGVDDEMEAALLCVC